MPDEEGGRAFHIAQDAEVQELAGIGSTIQILGRGARLLLVRPSFDAFLPVKTVPYGNAW